MIWKRTGSKKKLVLSLSVSLVWHNLSFTSLGPGEDVGTHESNCGADKMTMSPESPEWLRVYCMETSRIVTSTKQKKLFCPPDLKRFQSQSDRNWEKNGKKWLLGRLKSILTSK